MTDAAERKKLQRQGIKKYLVPLHTETVVSRLIAEGHLAELDRNDDAAIGEAVAKAFNQRGPVILRDLTKPEPKKPQPFQTYKAKAPDKAKHGPCRSVSLEEYQPRNYRAGPTFGVSINGCPPPDRTQPLRSGVNGRNVGVIPGPSYVSKPLPRSSDKTIKQLSEAKLKKLEKPFGELPEIGSVTPVTD